MLRNNFVAVDLDAIRNNYLVMRRQAPESVKIMPVIKADAYGHGMIPVAKALSTLGANNFAVALPDEGVALRESGVTANVLVLGAATKASASEAVKHDLTQTVFTPEMVALLDAEAKAQQKTALLHVKLDTGMNRIGLRTEEEARAMAAALAAASHVKATGIYTHFAVADEPLAGGGLNQFTEEQLARFVKLRAFFDPAIPAHVANSAMSLLAPKAYFSMIREGISLYGYPPVQTALPFQHALRWVTEIVHVKAIKAGETIGYGRTFTAPRDMLIATAAVGYGDGYHRAASNRGQMLVRGCRAPIVGRVCMDQTMLDVTDIPHVTVGDEVVLIGTQGNDEITAEELAAFADTISYEVLLSITARVPRIYLHV
ncbi:MAG: alanine racemase [Eubacteriales bacterium]|nr:alanine racemase [Eubacteriales bacterium]